MEFRVWPGNARAFRLVLLDGDFFNTLSEHHTIEGAVRAMRVQTKSCAKAARDLQRITQTDRRAA
tara:strand:- start:4241 stop:4435 length:195 start_codon:yes stop_codon:yes gene_type:complete